MAEIYVPNVMSFQNNNPFIGSFCGLRFRLVPDVEKETIQAEYWHGPLCYELSEMDGAEEFPLSAEGIASMKARLTALAEALPDANGAS